MKKQLTGITAPHYSESHVNKLVELGQDMKKLSAMEVDKYVDLYVKNNGT